MIRLRTLGALDLQNSEGQELRSVLAQPKRAAVLVYLALAAPRGPHRRDALLALFWPEQDAEHARNALSQAVHFLRRSVGSESIITGNGDGLTLERRTLWCDALAFEEAVDSGRTADALELYRGDLLDGFHITDAPEFERWLDAERARLSERYGAALESTAASREASGDLREAVALWRRLASRDPYNSHLALRLMQVMVAAGDPAGAVNHATSHEALLREELGVAPDAKVTAYVRRLQQFRLEEPLDRSTGEPPRFREVAIANPPPRASVAVLPFLNLSADQANEYFSDGMTEEILTALTKVSGLKVASRTSAFAFRGKNLDIREIAARLRVRSVLEGSVRREGSRVRVTAQLIDASDGYHLWSETYDREIAHVFALQDEISRAIVHALELRLSRDTEPTLVRSGTESVEAYELYLKGRFLCNARTPDGLKRGIRCFEQAVEVDPGYALPYSGIADSYHMLALYGTLRAHEAYPLSKAAALRALEIDEDIAEGHLSLACVAFAYEYDWVVAEREFRQAMQLNPHYAAAHHWFAWFLLAMTRREEALTVIRRAAELEPLSTIILARTGHICYYAGRPREGLHYCRLALDLDPDYSVAYEVLALIHSTLSELPQALDALEKLGTRPPSAAAPVLLPYVYAMAGRNNEARQLLERQGFAPEAGRAPGGYLPLWVCATHSLLGELDKAFDWLEWICNERSFASLLCHVVPGFDNLRSDPRFGQWVSKVGLPHAKVAPPIQMGPATHAVILQPTDDSHAGSIARID